MKILFLIALILAVFICIESYKGEQHMYYAPVNPDQGAQHMYYAPVNPHEDVQHMHYTTVNPDQGAQHMYYTTANPDLGAHHMMYYAQGNPDQEKQRMRHFAPNPDQGARHMLHYAQVNVHGAHHNMHYAQMNPNPGVQHVMHNAPVNPHHGLQHMKPNAQVNRRLCLHGRNEKNECLPDPFTYEYFTPEYSAEHYDSSESDLWPIRRTFCPKRYSWPCSKKVHECCSDNDCDPLQLCCFENCGNTCQFPVSFPTDGVKVHQHAPHCQVDPDFVKIPMPPIVKG